MNRKFALIGGDLRIVNLAKMLTEDNNLVYQYDSNCTSLVFSNFQHLKFVFSLVAYNLFRDSGNMEK